MTRQSEGGQRSGSFDADRVNSAPTYLGLHSHLAHQVTQVQTDLNPGHRLFVPSVRRQPEGDDQVPGSSGFGERAASRTGGRLIGDLKTGSIKRGKVGSQHMEICVNIEGKKSTDNQALQQTPSPLILQDVQQTDIGGVEEVIGRVGGFGQEHVGRGDLGVFDRLAEGLPGWVDNRISVKEEFNGAKLGMRYLRHPTSPS